MAALVSQSLQNRETALIEAGTGTGKTLAYLVPAVQHGRKVVISTGTKTLQEQLIQKDIPALRKAGFKFTSQVMKGRGNYLCPVRLDRFLREPLLETASEGQYMKRFTQWARKTKTGDRAELQGFPENLRFWEQVCSTSTHCLGSRCDFFSSCFVSRMRQAAAKADIIVVNHHLYFADMALKQKGPGEVIPKHTAVIFDEAHGLENVATEHFGISMSAARLAELTRDLRAELQILKLSPKPLIRSAAMLDKRAKAFFKSIDQMPGQDRFSISAEIIAKLGREYGQDLLDALTALADEIKKVAIDHNTPEIEALIRRCAELASDLGILLDDGDLLNVHWVERRPRGSMLHASPIEVAEILGSHFSESQIGTVLTSATLTTNGKFDFLKDRLGLSDEVLQETIPTIFDFRKQTRLYVPKDLPQPADPRFVDLLASRLTDFLKATSGRALVLFTSYRNMQGVYERLPQDLPFQLLMQGQAPKGSILEEFRNDTSSVLLATASFWQGVDVVGDSLSAVFIDKLPFASPGDPITQARIESARSRDKDPFWSYQVPSAILSLKQGLGRLIRSPEDRGVLAIADVRLYTKAYGKQILRSLPPSPMVRDIRDIAKFFSLKKSGDAARPRR